MNVEQAITDELRSVGAAVHPPPAPDPADLVRRSGEARTRRVVRAGASVLLAAAVVLGIILVGSHLADPKAGPSPEPQPTVRTGLPPQVAYVKDAKLVVDGAVVPGSWQSVTNAANSSLAAVQTNDDSVASIVLFRDGEEIERAAQAPHDQSARLSQDGTKAAWIEPVGSSFFLVVYDLVAEQEVGRLAVDSQVLGHVGEETEAWESLYQVTNDGRAFYGGVVAAHTWRPGGSPGDIDVSAYPALPTGFPSESDGLVQVSPDGTWGAWPTDHNGTWEGGAGWAGTYDGITLQRPDQDATRFTIPVTGADIRALEWEDATDILATVFDDPDGNRWHFVRCNRRTSTCEVAPTPETP